MKLIFDKSAAQSSGDGPREPLFPAADLLFFDVMESSEKILQYKVHFSKLYGEYWISHCIHDCNNLLVFSLKSHSLTHVEIMLPN